jgi:hypothetical protein
MDRIENIVPSNFSVVTCVFVAAENLFAEPLPNNGRLLGLHYSYLQGVMSQYFLAF